MTPSGPSRRPDPNLLCSPDQKGTLELVNQANVFLFISQFFRDDPGRNPFTRGTLLELHDLTIRGIFPCSGRFRDYTSTIRIGGASFTPIPAYKIEPAIAELFDDATALRGLWPGMISRERVVQATDIFYRLLVIHPFNGGNGRVARALFMLALYDARVLEVNEELFGFVARRRTQYLRVLRGADAGNMEAMYRYFFRGVLDVSLQRFINNLRGWEKRGTKAIALTPQLKLFCRPSYRAAFRRSAAAPQHGLP